MIVLSPGDTSFKMFSSYMKASSIEESLYVRRTECCAANTSVKYPSVRCALTKNRRTQTSTLVSFRLVIHYAFPRLCSIVLYKVL